ncbi:30S ribosomal protein S6 [Candidatus Fermentibacteria bacterium]|nr:30S ribosomal protein S6 [Candidatus Fermentibacteria bacterium]
MRRYETATIWKSDLTEADLQKEEERFVKVISSNGGRYMETERWGKRDFAYPIAKQTDGIYWFIQWAGESGAIEALDKHLKLNDRCLRHVTLRSEDTTPVEESEPIETAAEEPVPAPAAEAEEETPETEEPAEEEEPEEAGSEEPVPAPATEAEEETPETEEPAEEEEPEEAGSEEESEEEGEAEEKDSNIRSSLEMVSEEIDKSKQTQAEEEPEEEKTPPEEAEEETEEKKEE